ncbi:MAG: hypothetical protein ACLVKT_09345 [Intestinibacter bartlettii]|uniref:hypothetical protein n=1 Tax=Intestinibacter bartlettii TaxID=261299 RepID=UPI00399AF9B3
MNQNLVEILKIIVPTLGTVLVGIFVFTSKNRNSIKNNKSNNITNSSNVNVQENNYGVKNSIDK